MKYELISIDNPDSLSVIVGQYLRDGWTPKGGIGVTSWTEQDGYIKVLFCQAMVKLDKPEPESLQ